MKTKFVTIVTVTDPDTNMPIEVEIRKLENGLMVGIDESAIEGEVYSPYDIALPLEIPDDESGPTGR
jgi:hypothetical protein